MEGKQKVEPSNETELSSGAITVTAEQLAGLINKVAQQPQTLTAGLNTVPVSSSVNLYAPNGQVLIPVNGAAGTGLPSISLAASTTGPGGIDTKPEEASRKREVRLYKNREAARECRRKKKEYVKCLENRVAVLENQNKALIDELKSLKELYCQKDV